MIRESKGTFINYVVSNWQFLTPYSFSVIFLLSKIGRSCHSVLAAKARTKPKDIEIQQSVTFGSSENSVGEGERPRSGDKVGL